MDEFYKILLKNGEVLTELDLNGNNYISKTKVTEEQLSDENLKTFTIVYPDQRRQNLSDYECVSLRENSGEWWFVILPKEAPEYANMTEMKKTIDNLYCMIKESNENIQFIAGVTVSEKNAVNNHNIFPLWVSNSKYLIGNIVRYKDQLYKCLQSHDSLDTFDPENAVSLWVPIDDPNVEWPEWKMPTGAHNVYPKGYKVTHNGKRWVSNIDHNDGEPGKRDWVEYKPKSEDPDYIPDWVQPTGAHNAYSLGDKVKHKNQVWKSINAGNSWEPGVYGWVKIS